MWPRTVDLTVDECRKMLRKLELDAYSKLLDTFRAQGILDENKLKVLTDLRKMLNISDERHRSEIRRAANDEELGTVSSRLYGSDAIWEWMREGKRGAPLLYRSRPYSALSLAANLASDFGCQLNNQLQFPYKLTRELQTADLPHKTNIVQTDPIRTSVPVQAQKRPSLFYEKDDSNIGLINTSNTSSKMAKATPASTHPKYRKIQMKREKIKTARQTASSCSSSSQQVSSYSVETAKPTNLTATNLSRVKVVNSDKSVGKRRYVPVPEDSGYRIEDHRVRNKDLLPQIATSKKDITSNLTKLNQMVVTPTQQKNLTFLYGESPTPGDSAADPVHKYPKPPPHNPDWQLESSEKWNSNPKNFIRLSSSKRGDISSSISSPFVTSSTNKTQMLAKPKVQILSQTIMAPGSYSLKKGVPLKNLGNGKPITFIGGPSPSTVSSSCASPPPHQFLNGSHHPPPFCVAPSKEIVDQIKEDDLPNGQSQSHIELFDGEVVEEEEYVTANDSDIIMDAFIVEENEILDEHSNKIIIEMQDNSEIIEEDDGIVTEEYIDATDADIYSEDFTIVPDNGIVPNGVTNVQKLETETTDYEYLLDNSANGNQILVEEVDINGQLRKVTLEELLVSGQLTG